MLAIVAIGISVSIVNEAVEETSYGSAANYHRISSPQLNAPYFRIDGKIQEGLETHMHSKNAHNVQTAETTRAKSTHK